MSAFPIHDRFSTTVHCLKPRQHLILALKNSYMRHSKEGENINILYLFRLLYPQGNKMSVGD